MKNNKVASPIKKTYPSSPKGIDWIAAKQFYLDDYRNTYLDVSKEFKVSTTMIEDHGSKDAWVATRKALGEKAMQEFESNKVQEIANATVRHLSAYQKLTRIVEKRILNADDAKASELKALADTLEKSINGERLVLGLPTSVSKSEILGKLTTDLVLSPDVLASIDKFFKDEAAPAFTSLEDATFI